VGDDLVALAFAAGLVAALNPCGFAMLFGYLALVVRGDEESAQGAAVCRALAATAAMALGFVTVFGLFGLLAVSLASTLQQYLPYVTVLIGILLVALGIWLLLGREMTGLVLNRFASSTRWAPTARIGSMFGYGVGYAIASLSCTIGPFLAVTGAAFRGGPFVESLLIYLAYASYGAADGPGSPSADCTRIARAPPCPSRMQSSRSWCRPLPPRCEGPRPAPAGWPRGRPRRASDGRGWCRRCPPAARPSRAPG